MDGKAWLRPLLVDMVEVRLRVRSPDVVFVKGIMEASEGVGAVFAEPKQPHQRAGGDTRDPGALVLVAPRSRAADLHELIEDLREELGGNLWKDDAHSEGNGAAASGAAANELEAPEARITRIKG